MDKEERPVLASPIAKTMFNAYLKLPNTDKGEKYPRYGKQGNNLSVEYEIQLRLNPQLDKSHKLFLEDIATLMEDFSDIKAKKGQTLIVVNPLRPLKLKNKDTGELQQTNELIATFRTRKKPLVIENGIEVEGDKQLVDYGTTTRVIYSPIAYDFSPDEKTRIVGVKLELKSVEVLARPERKAEFKRKAKK